jgi:adenosylmethionine-8-amino-7-oxononanoate aminotransferase
LAKEDGPFVLDNVLRWSLGDGFSFSSLVRGACAAIAASVLIAAEDVLAAAADVASAAFLRTAASNAEEECTEGRLRAAPVVGAVEVEVEVEDKAAEGTEAGVEEVFFAGLFCA